MSNNFLPKDYKEVEVSKYLDFKTEGDYKFRVLSKVPEMGHQIFIVEDGKTKPMRKKGLSNEGFTLDELSMVEPHESKYGPSKPKFFWTMVVWNYEAKCYQVWTLTQKGLRKDLEKIIGNSDYGAPQGYDITVSRTDGDQVSYSIVPSPPKAVDKDISDGFANLEVDWDSWFSGEDDPF